MKTTKSPENTEITPSKKKLKQARLPFKLLSDVSPKPDVPSRKRKLSSPEVVSTTKVGKISKENDITEPVIISDEESKESPVENNSEKSSHPYVKIIDAARKKQQKSKKKKTSKKSSKVLNSSCEVETDSDNKVNESMDVDEPQDSENMVSNKTEESDTKEVNTLETHSGINKELDSKVDSESNVSKIITLEDSNDANDKGPEALDEKTENECDQTVSEEIIKESPSKTEGDNSNSKPSEEQVLLMLYIYLFFMV